MTGAFFVARELVQRGHSFTFFSSSYNYYQRREIRLNDAERFKSEYHDGVEFMWVRTRPHDKTLSSRALNMLSFFTAGLRAVRAMDCKPDVVIGTCPHLLGVLLAYLVARRAGARFAFEVRDLWPQTFVDHNVLSDTSMVTRALRKLELFLYRRADVILTVLPYAHRYIVPLGIEPEKVCWVPNGIRIDTLPPVAGYDGVSKFAPRTLFMYAGGHARYHGLFTVLEAIALVERARPGQALFRFIGEGVEKADLNQHAQALGLANVEFLDAVPRDELQRAVADADAFVYHMRKMNVLRFGVSPNKLCDYLGASRPVACALEAPNNPVADANAGVCVAPEDPEALAAALIQIMDMGPAERAELGRRGRQYVIDNFDCVRLAETLEQALSGSRPAGAAAARPGAVADHPAQVSSELSQ